MKTGNGRLSDHIRSNVVGYVALFFVFAGGAYALPGTNTVDSGDIQNGQVRSPDVGAGQVARSDLANDSVNSAKVASNSLGSGDIGNGKVRVLDLADGSVNSAKVADNSLTGGDVDESSFSGLVSGTGRVLTGSLNASSSGLSDGDPILALPGWGVIEVSKCDAGTVFASTAFDSNLFGPSGSAWTIGGADPASDRANFTPAISVTFGSDTAVDELLTVFLSRNDSAQVVTLQIAEKLAGVGCEFHVQALMSG